MENIFIMYYILYKRRIRPEIGFAKVIHKQCYINIMVVENIKKLLEIYRVLLMSRLFSRFEMILVKLTPLIPVLLAPQNLNNKELVALFSTAESNIFFL